MCEMELNGLRVQIDSQQQQQQKKKEESIIPRLCMTK